MFNAFFKFLYDFSLLEISFNIGTKIKKKNEDVISEHQIHREHQKIDLMVHTEYKRARNQRRVQEE